MMSMYHKKLFTKYNIRMVYGDINSILIGKLPIRSIDTKKDYKTIIWKFDYSPDQPAAK